MDDESWPYFEREELPFYSGYPLLEWEGEFVREDEVSGDIPLMERYVHDPLYSSMESLPQHNMLHGEIFNGLDGEIGTWDYSSLGLESNKDKYMAGISYEETVEELKEKKIERGGDLKSMTREELSRYYDKTITDAAKELKVGLTLLKKKCRELDIPRWPHRKMKSLKTLINNLQELDGLDGEVGETQLRTADIMQQRKLMEKIPAMQIEESTKKLRQACFKAKYKKRRLMEMVD